MATLKASRTAGTKKVTARKSAEVIEHTFSDGTKFVGTFDQLEKVASALGMKITGVGKTPRGYYMSDSKGLVKITEMNDHHIRRALVKRSKDYFTEVYLKDDTNKEFLRKYTDLTLDNVVVDLFNELQKRG
jgi:hypothetical protein